MGSAWMSGNEYMECKRIQSENAVILGANSESKVYEAVRCGASKAEETKRRKQRAKQTKRNAMEWSGVESKWVMWLHPFTHHCISLFIFLLACRKLKLFKKYGAKKEKLWSVTNAWSGTEQWTAGGIFFRERSEWIGWMKAMNETNEEAEWVIWLHAFILLLSF